MIQSKLGKRLFLLLVALLFGVTLLAYNPEIRRIEISCQLDSLGSAHITEVWDVTVASGTEWYLVRENLGDINLLDLSVRDGDTEFAFIPQWDVNKSREDKRGTCGFNRTSNGYEICWGVGDYGDHIFTVSYVMTNAVKSLTDYDILHLQFISDELSSSPRYAKVTVSVPGTDLSSDNARIWGFGYVGDALFVNGNVQAQTGNGLGWSDSMILLLRLDKGVIDSPQSFRDMDFQSVYEKASQGSDWDKKPESLLWKIIEFICIIIGLLLNGLWVVFLPFYIIIEDLVRKRKFLGIPKRKVMWSRDVPFDGNLCVTDYVLGQVGESQKKSSIASAMILQMIQSGAIEVRAASAKSPVELVLGDRSKLESFPEPVKALWDMIHEASGDDEVLQSHEFGRWSGRNKKRVSDWVDSVNAIGKQQFESDARWCTRGKIHEMGREEARRALGFKKFLVDFTLIKQRASRDVILWNDYLIFGALFGVAKQVAKELKDIDPKMYEVEVPVEPVYLGRVVDMSDTLASAITEARASHVAATRASSGYGGSSSHGGGGGFSGGGHGGGSR